MGTCDMTQDEWIPKIQRNLDPDVGAIFLGYCITEADYCLDGIYGDHGHANNGTHLDGGIVDDVTW